MNAFPPRICQQNRNQRLLFSLLLFFLLLATSIALLQIVYYLVISSPILSMFIFFFLASCALVFSRLKMKTLHGGPGEHRSHLHVAVFFWGGGGSFFLFRLGVRLHFFLSSGVFFVPSEPDYRRVLLAREPGREASRKRGELYQKPSLFIVSFLILLCTCFFLQGGCLLFLTFLIPG